MKKTICYLMSVILALGICIPGGALQAAFADGGVPVNVTITKFQILNINKEEVHTILQSDRFYLAMDWDASAAGTNIHEGDYFDITLPDNMKFPSGTTARDFDLADADGNVVAKAHVTPGPSDAGGTVHVTFTKAAENKYNVKGTMYLAAQFDITKIIKDAENVFTITVNSQAFSSSVTVASPGLAHNESLAKWGKPVPGHEDQAEWNVRINHKKANLPNAVISDSLSGGNGDERYIADSFKLLEVEFNEYGGIVQEIQTVDLTDKLQIAPDGRSFTINLGNVNGKQYRLYYKSTYHAGTVLKNKATLDASSSHSEASYSYQSANSGGTAGGDLASKIKLTKVDADDNAVVLKNAVFTVTRPDGSTFELTTGTDGTVTSGVLTQGTYKVKEKTPPDGYELNDEEYTLEVTPAGGALKTICDRPVKVNVDVTKKWVGPEGGEVTAHLLADGADTGKELKLNAGNGWKGTFDDLRKYKAGTADEIAYTVKEDPVANYDGDVTGDAASGFTITNTNKETVDVSGTKSWDDDDDRDGVRPASITVNLMRDGAKADSKTVTPDASGMWAYAFTGLPKYDPADGHEYAYTVTEEAVPNYETSVNGTDITNSYTPGKTSVTVTKAWADANDQDGLRPASIKAQLYANGKPLGAPVELSEANGWTHTWTGLNLKEAGKAIAYTVKEAGVPSGYDVAVAGDATAGYTVTNTHTPATVDVSVEKKWVGPKGSEVTVRLLADGKDTGKELKLDADNNWSGAFSGLPKYDHGREIVYTVTEAEVAGVDSSKYETGVAGSASDGYVITNTNTETVKVPVEKKWVGPAGSEVTVRLLADGADTGRELKLNAGNGWKGSFDGLPKYNADGSEIAYTVTEAEVSGVDSSKYGTAVDGDAASGFTITNANKETVDVSGTKSWDDDDDRDGVRPASITVNLMRDGAKADSRTVAPDASGMWAYSFTGLPKYAADGHEYAYTVTEEAVPNYATAVAGTDITNSYTPGKTSVTVTKAWADANDRDGMRPASVKAQLYADGKPLGDPVELSEANSWTHTWTGLFMKEAGKDVAYTVKEVSVPKGYEASAAGDAKAGYTLTNTHEPETVSVPVEKKWVGGEGGEVTVRLLADGRDTGKALKLNAGNNWKGSFDGLPAFEGGKRIAYAVAEDAVEGYSSKVTGDASKGFTVTNTKDGRPEAPAPGGGKKAMPKTGDGTGAMALGAGLAGLLSLGLLGLAFRRRRAE